MLLTDLAAYLQAQGIGTLGTDMFYGILPDTPDACVCLFEYGGLANEPALGKGVTNLEFPSVQVVTRGVRDDYDTARLKIQNVVTAFAAVANQTIVATSYKAIAAKQPPFFLMRDENFRIMFAVNFQVTRSYSAT